MSNDQIMALEEFAQKVAEGLERAEEDLGQAVHHRLARCASDTGY
ncbi:MAG: hypothetical protein ACETWR_00320 [Anaerolineae bacterium]